MRYRYPQRGGCVPFVCFLYGWNGWYGLEGYLNGIGRAIVLARENDTPDRWGDWGSAFPLSLPEGPLQKWTGVLAAHLFLCLSRRFASKLAPVGYKHKKTGRFSSSGSFLRRGRDSNPRILSDQRFSRPPQSTTLPPLQVLRVCFGIAKVGIIFVSPNLFSRKLIFSAK